MGKARCSECGHGEGDESETQALYARIERLRDALQMAHDWIDFHVSRDVPGKDLQLLAIHLALHPPG